MTWSDAATPPVTAAWCRLARWLRPIVPVSAGPLPPEGAAGPVLVLSPHPDDEVHAAATWLEHQARGAKVVVLILSDGSGTRRIPGDRAAVAAVRRREAEEARRILDPARWEWLGFQDGALEAEAIAAVLTPIITAERPAVVYAPSLVDGHPDHLATTLALAHSLGGLEPRVRLYPVQVPLTPLLTNVAIDGSAHRAQVLQAFSAHRSQAPSWAPVVRSKAYAANLYGGGTWVDELWEVSVQGLRRALEAPTPPGLVGLREAPFRDPLAYLSGWRLRRGLRAAASTTAEKRATQAPSP